MNVRASKRPRNTSPAQQPRPTDLIEASLTVEHKEFWQGPLPSPSTLAEFRELVPDAPERIFQQWETEAAHRRSYEQTALQAAVGRDKRGQWSASLFAVSALAVSAFALWMNQPWVAGTIGGGTIVSVVGAFLYQRRAQK